ncbi:DNA primase family protein [Brachybacterium saurashtrense]|nr:phage/plasmid primase, P4 family [Brachybacterium saurashtrense]
MTIVSDQDDLEQPVIDEDLLAFDGDSDDGIDAEAEREFLLQDAETLRSHARIASLVAAECIDRFIHVAGLGWHRYDGKRFRLDLEDKAITRAVTRAIGRLAPEALGDKDLLADLVKSQTSSGLAGVVRLMSTIEGLSADAEELDADPWLLNTPTGVLDLRELERGVDWRCLTVHPHDPKYRMTRITRGGYDPAARSEVFERFISRSLPDEGVCRYLQQTAGGLGLIGEQLEHLLPILTGEGRNGKGVLYGAVLYAVGDYGAVANPALFNVDRNATADKPNPALLGLRAVRLVFMSETAKTAELDSAKVKSLTGGDPIKARGVHSKITVEFEPSHQLVLITNHAPQLPADDPAVWERVTNVPWDVVVPPEERDPRLGRKLRTRQAADAILAWALQGLQDYVRNGIVVPERVAAATDEYKADQDTVSNFIEERCEDGCSDRDSDGTKTLHADYQKYCRANGVMREHILGEKDFGTRLDALGYKVKRANGRRFRQGLRLLPDDDEARAEQIVSESRERIAQRYPLNSPADAERRRESEDRRELAAIEQANREAEICSCPPPDAHTRSIVYEGVWTSAHRPGCPVLLEREKSLRAELDGTGPSRKDPAEVAAAEAAILADLPGAKKTLADLQARDGVQESAEAKLLRLQIENAHLKIAGESATPIGLGTADSSPEQDTDDQKEAE